MASNLDASEGGQGVSDGGNRSQKRSGASPARTTAKGDRINLPVIVISGFDSEHVKAKRVASLIAAIADVTGCVLRGTPGATDGIARVRVTSAKKAQEVCDTFRGFKIWKTTLVTVQMDDQTDIDENDWVDTWASDKYGDSNVFG